MLHRRSERRERKRMDSMGLKLQEKQPHAVCMPFPMQGHITPMLKLAKILHSKGFLITFVHTEFNHQRLLKSRGSDALGGLPSFRFETISDGLPPPENLNATQDLLSLGFSTEQTCLVPFKNLIAKVSASYSPVTCIVADLLMSFTVDAGQELGLPVFLFWICGAGSLVCADQYPKLIEKGLMPLKDRTYLSNGYLDTVIDWIPSMPGIRLKDVTSFIRMTNPGDKLIVYSSRVGITRAKRASAIIFHTFEELEYDILETLSSMFPSCYGIGPLSLMEEKLADRSLTSIGSNLWKEEHVCLQWLDSKAASSVVYVNFGSIIVLTVEQLVEFCWGLAKSNYAFLWIIRPDLVKGDNAVLPQEFISETRSRGMLASWCPQEQVLKHPSIGGFLTHSGWNSTIESISSGVPMLCWPFFGDQQTNCWLSCTRWGVAMEINNDVKRNEVEKLVRELMAGQKGKEMKKNAIRWKKKAEDACFLPSGSSFISLEKLLQKLQETPK